MKNALTPVLRGLLAVTMILLCVSLCGCEATVSETQYEEAQAEIARLKNENADARRQLQKTEAERNELQSRLSTAQMQKIEHLMDKFHAAQEEAKAANRRAVEMEKVGFDRGALEVYRSIQIVGRPRVVRGILIDDWYYDFTVEIDGHNLSAYSVETKQECSPVVQGLSTVANVAALLK